MMETPKVLKTYKLKLPCGCEAEQEGPFSEDLDHAVIHFCPKQNYEISRYSLDFTDGNLKLRGSDEE